LLFLGISRVSLIRFSSFVGSFRKLIRPIEAAKEKSYNNDCVGGVLFQQESLEQAQRIFLCSTDTFGIQFSIHSHLGNVVWV